MKSALLIAERHILSGGLLRFFRVARHLRNHGIELHFTTIGPLKGDYTGTLPYIPWKEVTKHRWDFSMLPGAGFSPKTIELFKRCKDKSFGVRVQHILNDATLAESFAAVNRAYKPDLVITNNHHWKPEEYGSLSAGAFETLVGGVEVNLYQNIKRLPFSQRSQIVIGGQSRKNSAPLISAILSLPNQYHLNLMGTELSSTPEAALLFQQGRLTLTPCTSDKELRNYHARCDVIVSTEKFAGWANIVAEGMAAGSAIITTPCGTLDLVINGKTGLVMDNPSPREIADRIRSLSRWPTTTDKMIQCGLENISQFDWQPYGKRMAEILCNIAN